MKTLTSEHLQEMIERCVAQANTKGLIVTETERKAREVCASFRENSIDEIKIITSSPFRNDIRFKNGSCITVKSASDNLRGYRADLILYDDLVDEVMYPILRNCELSRIAREYANDTNRWTRTNYTATDAGTYMSSLTLSELTEWAKKNLKTTYMGSWTSDRSADDSGNRTLTVRRTGEPEDEPSPELDNFLDSFIIRSDN